MPLARATKYIINQLKSVINATQAAVNATDQMIIIALNADQTIQKQQINNVSVQMEIILIKPPLVAHSARLPVLFVLVLP